MSLPRLQDIYLTKDLSTEYMSYTQKDKKWNICKDLSRLSQRKRNTLSANAGNTLSTVSHQRDQPKTMMWYHFTFSKMTTVKKDWQGQVLGRTCKTALPLPLLEGTNPWPRTPLLQPSPQIKMCVHKTTCAEMFTVAQTEEERQSGNQIAFYPYDGMALSNKTPKGMDTHANKMSSWAK